MGYNRSKVWKSSKFYKFPAIIGIDESMDCKLDHMREEAWEAQKAYDEHYEDQTKESEDHFIEEVLDTLHTAETILREFPIDRVLDIYRKVIKKNNQRGYYGE